MNKEVWSIANKAIYTAVIFILVFAIIAFIARREGKPLPDQFPSNSHPAHTYLIKRKSERERVAAVAFAFGLVSAIVAVIVVVLHA